MCCQLVKSGDGPKLQTQFFFQIQPKIPDSVKLLFGQLQLVDGMMEQMKSYTGLEYGFINLTEFTNNLFSELDKITIQIMKYQLRVFCKNRNKFSISLLLRILEEKNMPHNDTIYIDIIDLNSVPADNMNFLLLSYPPN